MTREEWLAAYDNYRAERGSGPMHLMGVPGPDADRLLLVAHKIIEQLPEREVRE
jgi:hypothetical protein